MRVVGVLLLLVSGPVFASEAGELVRFAYASPLLADTSFDGTTVVSKTSTAAHDRGRRPATRLLQFASAEQLAPLLPDRPRTSKPVSNPVPTVASSGTARTVAVPKVPVAKSTVAPMVPKSAARELVAEVVPPSRPREQLVAALPEPMHVLPPEPAEPSSQNNATGSSHSRTAHPRKFPAHVKQDDNAQNLDKTSFVPPWAAQMFDTIWQRHAFSYQ